jgi:hypothetical protein
MPISLQLRGHIKALPNIQQHLIFTADIPQVNIHHAPTHHSNHIRQESSCQGKHIVDTCKKGKNANIKAQPRQAVQQGNMQPLHKE